MPGRNVTYDDRAQYMPQRLLAAASLALAKSAAYAQQREAKEPVYLAAVNP